MSAQVQHVRLHTAEAAEAIITTALEIADRAEVDERIKVHVFDKACDLLAAGVVLTPQPGMVLGDIDLSKLRG